MSCSRDDAELNGGKKKRNKESCVTNGIDPQKNMDTPCKPPGGWGARHTLAFLGFWAFAVSYAMRFNLSIAIVAMVNTTKAHGANGGGEGLIGTRATVSDVIGNYTFVGKEREEACLHLIQNDSLSENKNGGGGGHDGEFNWNAVEQGIILGSFFWGYVVTQLPGGILATKYGGKWTLGLGLFVTAIFAILTPILARTHVYLLVLARVVQGLGEGVTTPAMHAILAQWAPPHERSLLGSIVYAGAQFGTAVTMVISGYLIHGGVMGGWPSVFYLIGGFSVVWFILWVMLMHDTPQSHPRISKEELEYILQSIGNIGREPEVEGGGGHDGNGPTPWMEMAKSVPLWAIMVAHVGHAYGLYTILTLLPTYLDTVLHFDIKENSLINAVPYLIMWGAALGTTQVADKLIGGKYFKTVTVRKACQAIGHIGSAGALIGASYSGCDRTVTVFLLTVAVGMNGAIYGGYVVNHVDISPNWAGILMGITNTFANLTGFAAPYVAGLLINDDPSIQNWQYVFFIAAGIYLFDVIIYVIFASGSEQSWNRAGKTEDKCLKDHHQLQEIKQVVTA